MGRDPTILAPGSLAERACAKINLTLHVMGRRDDGYHDIESLVAFVDIADLVQLQKAKKLSLEISGPFAGGLETTHENLAYRAAEILGQEYRNLISGLDIKLEKNLPIAAGLGGGSADAAAILRGLVKLFDIEISQENLLKMASQLGADVPVCVLSATAFISGIGTNVTPLGGLPGLYTVLVNPGIEVSTAEIYQTLNPVPARAMADQLDIPDLSDFLNIETLITYLKTGRNDLQMIAIDQAPEIGQVLALLSAQPNCLLARMSGSGASCFGLFANEVDARNGANEISSERPDWWAECGKILV